MTVELVNVPLAECLGQDPEKEDTMNKAAALAFLAGFILGGELVIITSLPWLVEHWPTVAVRRPIPLDEPFDQDT